LDRYEEYLRFIDRQWERFAAFAWRAYELLGPGAVMVVSNAPLDERFWFYEDAWTQMGFEMGRPMRGGYLPIDAIKKCFPAFDASYFPELEILLAYVNSYTGIVCFLKLDKDPRPVEAVWDHSTMQGQ